MIGLPVIGGIVDRLLIRRQQIWLHERLVGLWDRIDDISVPDLASTAARYVLRLVGIAKPRKWFSKQSAVVIAVVLAASWTLTTLFNMSGWLIDGMPEYFDNVPLPVLYVYMLNGIFDAATIYVTLRAMRSIAAGGLYRSLVAVAVDAAAAIVLMVYCLGGLLTVWHSGPGAPETVYVPPPLRDAIAAELSEMGIRPSNFDIIIERSSIEDNLSYSALTIEGLVIDHQLPIHPFSHDFLLVEYNDSGDIVAELTATAEIPHRPHAMIILMASSTLLPTIVFLAVILLLATAKATLELVRWLALHWLERATEAIPDDAPQNFMPFTLLGSMVAFAVAMSSAIVWIMSNI